MPVYGRGKQGAAFGYTKVRGYHPQFATCADTGMVLYSRLRGGSGSAVRGAKPFLTETVSRVRRAGATGQLTVRTDSAFYSRAVLGTAVTHDVQFSITARQDKKIRAAIDGIDNGSPSSKAPASRAPRPRTDRVHHRCRREQNVKTYV